MEDHQKAYAAALLQTSIIGFSFMFVKLALITTNPIDTLAHRFTVAFLIAMIPVILGKVEIKVAPKDILAILPLTLFYPILFFLFQTFGLAHLPSSEAGIIQALAPILTMLLAFFFLGERTNRIQIAFIFLSVSGVLFVTLMKGVQAEVYDLAGTIFILSSTLSVAGYNVLTRKLVKRYPLYTLTFITTTLGWIIFASISLLQHGIAGTLNDYFAPFGVPIFTLSMLYLGGLSSLGTAFLGNYALSKITASKMSVFGNLATVITIFAGAIFLGEDLGWYHLLGAAVIVTGVLGTNHFGYKDKAASPENK